MKGGAAGLSGVAALVLLLPMEAGVPIPLPADLVMFTVGERVDYRQVRAAAGPDPGAGWPRGRLRRDPGAPRARAGARDPRAADPDRDSGGRLRAERAACAARAFNQAKGPALAVLAVLVAGTLVFWRVRRRKGGTPGAWREASCPACLGVSLLAERVPALAELTEAEGVPS